MKVKLRCLQCNKEFERFPSAIKQGSGKCCSRSCSTNFLWSKNGYKQHMSNIHKGKVSGSKGFKWNKESKLKLSLSKKGTPSSMGMLGKKHTLEAKEKISLSHKGIIPKNVLRGDFKAEKNWKWKGGISKGYKTGYYSMEYKNWRKSVFERDNFSCQECGEMGYITAHHIKSFAHYPELRFELSNGKTLCEDCHKLTDNYKGRAKGFKRVMSISHLTEIK